MTLAGHVPVLLDEVLRYLEPAPRGRYLDATVGGGGHARAILAAAGEDAFLVGLDRDPEARRRAERALQGAGGRVRILAGRYEELDAILEAAGLGDTRFDGILFDLGVSSFQVDEARRGFTYQDPSAPLDMRMDPSQPTTAADLVNGLSLHDLARVFKEYGEERWAARIARFVVERRRRRPLATAGDLVEVVKAAVPAAARREAGHPARRVFQALRIAVNGELERLDGALRAAVRRLRPGGRLVVISFHSLEDRIVKETFRELALGCICPPELPVCSCGRNPEVRLLTRTPVVPAAEERERNPRARSARLRAAARVLGPQEAE
ncbi:16S rRNA (cytosine(1402)-N(4))-methyltransferase RsmH [Limnochorda pilosa]|uniref:Ribosomal RNA small subunit methyltransferase H n=1 Tax=Limnochorda pilosa TaxID=1555112 RepID=A0A0K2SLM1_LIMPI|nr:16S rRNA methyltransferase [Limnochorda pilosa]